MLDSNQADQVPEAEEISKEDAILMNAVQLLLAEKRTSLSSLRTGIAIIALPLAILGVLIATSKQYDILHVVALLVPVLAICGALILLGFYVVITAVIRIHHQNRMVREIKRKHRVIAGLMD